MALKKIISLIKDALSLVVAWNNELAEQKKPGRIEYLHK